MLWYSRSGYLHFSGQTRVYLFADVVLGKQFTACTILVQLLFDFYFIHTGIKKRSPPPQSLPFDSFAHADDVDKPAKNMWLFDIDKDPLEAVELSEKYPGIVKLLLDKLLAYNSTAVPVIYPPFDPNSLPSKHGGVWGPWLDWIWVYFHPINIWAGSINAEICIGRETGSVICVWIEIQVHAQVLIN